MSNHSADHFFQSKILPKLLVLQCQIKRIFKDDQRSTFDLFWLMLSDIQVISYLALKTLEVVQSPDLPVAILADPSSARPSIRNYLIKLINLHFLNKLSLVPRYIKGLYTGLVIYNVFHKRWKSFDRYLGGICWRGRERVVWSGRG